MIDEGALRKLGWSEQLIAEVTREAQAIESLASDAPPPSPAAGTPSTVAGGTVISEQLDLRAQTSVIWQGQRRLP